MSASMARGRLPNHALWAARNQLAVCRTAARREASPLGDRRAGGTVRPLRFCTCPPADGLNALLSGNGQIDGD